MLYHFADCRLDIERHEFARAGTPVPMEPQVFDLLHLLVRNVGDLVSHEQITNEVWQGRIVSDSTISARMNAVRKAVGDTGKDQKIIKTLPRRGFQLVVAVQKVARPGAALKPGAPPERQKVRFTTSKDGTGIAYATSGEGPPLMRAGH